MAKLNREAMLRLLPILPVAVHTTLCIATQVEPSEGSWQWFLVTFIDFPVVPVIWTLGHVLPAVLCYVVFGGVWWYFIGRLPAYCSGGKLRRGTAPVAAVLIAILTVPDFTIILQNLDHGLDIQLACIFALIIFTWLIALDLLWFALRGHKVEALPRA